MQCSHEQEPELKIIKEADREQDFIENQNSRKLRSPMRALFAASLLLSNSFLLSTIQSFLLHSLISIFIPLRTREGTSTQSKNAIICFSQSICNSEMHCASQSTTMFINENEQLHRGGVRVKSSSQAGQSSLQSAVLFTRRKPDNDTLICMSM